MLIAALLFGALVGGALGLLGGGGSTLAVPLLVYGLGMEPRSAIASSLVIVGLAAAFGATRYWRSGEVDGRIAMAFGVTGAIGSAAGAQLSRFFPSQVLMIGFSLLVVIAAVFMFRNRGKATSRERKELHVISPKILLAGLGTGLLTGLVGIGGGFLIVPVLALMVGLPMRLATGTSLLIIFINALGGIASYGTYLSFDAAILAPFVIGAIVATIGGEALSRHMSAARLRITFASVLILVGGFTLAQQAYVTLIS